MLQVGSACLVCKSDLDRTKLTSLFLLSLSPSHHIGLQVMNTRRGAGVMLYPRGVCIVTLNTSSSLCLGDTCSNLPMCLQLCFRTIDIAPEDETISALLM